MVSSTLTYYCLIALSLLCSYKDQYVCASIYLTGALIIAAIDTLKQEKGDISF